MREATAGEPVAMITPTPRASGAALIDLFSRCAALDGEGFAETVAGIREAARPDLDGDPWHDRSSTPAS